MTENEALARYLGAALTMMRERHGPRVKFLITARVIPTDVELSQDPDHMAHMVLVGNDNDLSYLKEVLCDLLDGPQEG